jgi:hypothetical protein
VVIIPGMLKWAKSHPGHLLIGDTLIPRGYGETEGVLKNGVKVKVIRDRKHFLCL